MSIISVGYSIDLQAMRQMPEDDANAFYELAIEELSSRRVVSTEDREVLKICLGLQAPDGIKRDLAVPFRWICKNIGMPIHTETIVTGVYNLELPTGLLDAKPPFDFPIGDENVFMLNRYEISKELEAFSNSAKEAQTSTLSLQRTAFLKWLSECNSHRTDLVVIES
ncbi:MAG: hypothetical protein ACK6A7_22150 [Planctomycetota bacterium]